MNIKKLLIFGVIICLINSAGVGLACTGFTASDENKVLVGINEDNQPSRRWVEVFPPEEGKFGKIFFCYQVNGRQQGMNDQGLFWDGFLAPYLEITKGEGKIPIPDRQYFFNATLAENCSTVYDVVDLLDSHDIRDFGYERLQILFVDRFGNSMIFEGDEYVFKEGDYQAVTNFYQTHPDLGGYGFDRYETAINMLENMDDFSMDYFRDICSATSQSSTIYSIVCNLTSGLIHYYYAKDFDNVWEIDLYEEFQFGYQTYDVLDVFNNNKPDKPNSPVGPNSCEEYTTQEYSCQATDIDGDRLYYKWDFGDGVTINWIGPFESGETCTQSHQWIDAEKYQVKVMVRDENCGKSEWSDPLEIQVTDLDNNRPDKPLTPSGPSNGKSGEEYAYTTSTTDPDGNQLFYMWDWGDGTFSDWIGPYNAGDTCEAAYTWGHDGSYSIRVMAKDAHGGESDWSDPLPVSMPLRHQTLLETIIEWILQLFRIITP